MVSSKFPGCLRPSELRLSANLHFRVTHWLRTFVVSFNILGIDRTWPIRPCKPEGLGNICVKWRIKSRNGQKSIPSLLQPLFKVSRSAYHNWVSSQVQLFMLGTILSHACETCCIPMMDADQPTETFSLCQNIVFRYIPAILRHFRIWLIECNWLIDWMHSKIIHIELVRK